MRKTLTTWCAVTAALLLCAPSPARAEFPHPAVYIGVYGGANLALLDWNLGSNAAEATTRAPAVLPNAVSGIVGGRLGIQAATWLAIEAEVAYLPIGSTKNQQLNNALTYNIDLIFHLIKANWSPTIEVGGGVYQNLQGDLGADLDPRVHAGIGLRGLLTPWLALRASVRDVISNGFGSAGCCSNNLEITLGLDLFLWRGGRPAKPAAPKDTDQDGILDRDDACPNDPGPEATRGCPDSDGDGVADKDDKCPKVAGPAASGGCPDTDGDGVVDVDDKCVDVPQGKIPDPKRPGCPQDKDGDGVIDEKDQCVDVAQGKFPDPKRAGCPDDRDGDGVIDEKDQCIDVPSGKVADPAKAGCPDDKDGDSVPDEVDACPDKVGAPDPDPKKNGCPGLAMIKDGQIVIMEQVYFATGKDAILPKSFPVLTAVGNAIRSLPVGRRIGIEGHTDNKGKPDKNKTLSQLRADAVKKYLAEKEGVAVGRMDSVGLGQERPIADNKTEAGRSKNRRVEFHIAGVANSGQ